MHVCVWVSTLLVIPSVVEESLTFLAGGITRDVSTFARHDKGDGPTIQRTRETVRSRLLGGRSCGCRNSEVLDLLFDFVNKVGSAGAVYHPMIEG